MKPRLLRNGLTGQVYVVTRYTINEKNPNVLIAQRKYDVTEDFKRILAESQGESE